MNVEEQAMNYAEGKVQEALTEVVKKAFADGYDAGFKDAMAELKVAPNVEENGVTYVDLGLPSGTLWSSDYLRDDKGKLISLKYDQAAPLSLPTEAKLNELLSCCDVSINTISKDGLNERIVYNFSRNGKTITMDNSDFWLRTPPNYNPNEQIKKAVANLIKVDYIKNNTCFVRLVK